MLNEIRAINCSVAKDFYKLLSKRIDACITVYSTLLNFFKNPNKESDFDEDVDTILIKFELKVFILHFAKSLEKKFCIDSVLSTSIIASLFSLLKCYLMPSKNAKPL